MRKNPDYAIYYNNWARLAVLGIFPALMLIYLNYKVFVQTFTGRHGNPLKERVETNLTPAFSHRLQYRVASEAVEVVKAVDNYKFLRTLQVFISVGN